MKKKPPEKMNNLYSYVIEGIKRNQEYRIHGYIPVVIKDRLFSDEVNIDEFIEKIEEKIPRHLLGDIDIVYIGDFPSLEGRTATFADGAIYISNREPTTHDMLESVIHEIAHSIESKFGAFIYGDNKLRNEFLGKREKLKDILDAQGYEIPEKYYLNSEYSKAFDEFLSDSIGYPVLLALTMGLFASPYGATSLREYFANGFEKYYLGEGHRVKEVSPLLYNILNSLHVESDNQLTHISYSELKNWEFCPFYHKLTYIDGIKSFKGNEYTAFGTAIHDVCEKKLLKEDFNAEETFVEKFQKELKRLENDKVEFNLERAMEMVPQAISLLPEIEPALEAYFKKYEIISSEEKLMVPINENIDFKGYIDAVVKTSDGKYHIVDWKSTSWGWNSRRRSDPMVTYQLTLYKYFFCQKHNIDHSNVETHFALLKRTADKNKVEFFRVSSGMKKTENALKLLHMALYNIEKQRYLKKRSNCHSCAFNMTKECP